MNAPVGYRCPQCGEDARTIDSRPAGDARRRRRECTKCAYRFTTKELRVPDGIGPPPTDGPFNGGISIVSDGTPQGSKVLDGAGRELRGVSRVTWTIEAGSGLAHAALEFEGVPVAVQALDVEAVELSPVVMVKREDGNATSS